MDHNPQVTPRRVGARTLLLTALLLALFAGLSTAALANAPNPTSVVVEHYESLGAGKVKVTVSGTWTWDTRVPNGAQKDCNDQRSGVGYAVIWGDNNANPLTVQGTKQEVFVGDSEDDWVHSVTQGKTFVSGPFQNGPASMVFESMTGETPEQLGQQGISDGANTAVPTKPDAEHWVSNCGPTRKSTVNGQVIGNSEENAAGTAGQKELENGYPNGTWGPISHIYTTAGPHTICPVMYDPHHGPVGASVGSAKVIIAGGSNHNGDNSIESNENSSACVVAATLPTLTTTANPPSTYIGQPLADSATISGNNPQGTLSWALYGPFNSSSEISSGTCAALAPAYSSGSVTVNGNGTYSSPAPPPSVSVAGIYQWVATYSSSNPNSNTSVGPVGCGEASEQVVVSSAPAPGFKIEKFQRIGNSSAFTQAELTGEVGQVVEYEMVVSNTGNTTLTFSAFSDEHCDPGTLVPPPITSVAPGGHAVYTCSHTLTGTDQGNGSYKNTATVTGGLVTEQSNTVVVNVPSAPSFTIEKLQRIDDNGQYTTFELTGEVGQTVNYEIIVTNTGNATLSLSNFTDEHCDPHTIVFPPKATVPPQGQAVFTCSHILTTFDQTNGYYKNVAIITGGSIIHASNPVIVGLAPAKQAVKAVCALSESTIALRGISGVERRSFTARIAALGIKQVTFYLDGKKLKTLKSSQAKKGVFSVTIDPSRLSYGAHRLSVKTVMSDPNCANIARAAVFVRPHPPVVKPKFTG